MSDVLIKNATFLDRALQYPVATTGLRGLTAMGALYLSSDYLRRGGNLVAAFARTAHSLRHFKKIHEYTTSVLVIDDNIDNSKGDVVLAAGAAYQGPDFCDFLKSPDICPPAYFQTLKNLIELGMVTDQAAIAFSNLFAMLCVERARHEVQARSSGRVESRQNVLDVNILTTQVYTVFIFQCINRYKSTQFNNPYLTIDNVLEAFPTVSRLTGLLQVIDDARDVLIDLETEIATGVVSPNAVAAKMDIQGSLGNGLAHHQGIRQFVEDRAHCAGPLSWQDSPRFLQDAFYAIRDDFARDVQNISDVLPRAIAIAMFNNSICEGFKSGAHPDLMHKAALRQQQIAALQAKYP